MVITKNRTLTLAVMAMTILAASANAQVIVTEDHIVSGSATATLVAIDVPYQSSLPAYGGPDWPEDADDGFMTVNDGIMEENGASRWEPDGTPLSEAMAYFTYGNGPVPGVKYVFDLPDDAIIYAIYTTWNTRNSDGCTYQYTEGAASDTFVTTQQAVPNGDLVLRWTDSSAATHDGDFELLFTGPITVTGGDGFELWATDNIGNAAHIDAVVIDVTIYTDPNLPSVEAGVGMITWSGQAVQLAPTVVNNDSEVPQRTLSYLWTAEPVDGVVFSPSAIVEAPTVTITKATANPSPVMLTLAVTLEGDGPVPNSMKIDVYDDSCLAAKATGTVEIEPTDFDDNCITNIADFAKVAADWLLNYEITEPIVKP